MRDYDWSFGFGFGARHPVRRSGYDRGAPGGGYGRQPLGGGPYGFGRTARPERGAGSRGGYDRGGYGTPGGAGRGIYGEDHPVFGGISGGRREGMYYGGPGGRRAGGAYGADFERGGGWGRPGSHFPRREPQLRRGPGGWGGARYARELEPRRGRYDEAYTREPFLPDSAYARHPELDRPPPQRDRWNASRYGVEWTADDAEIEYGVRQSLYQDSYIDADRIEVEVDEGVVTLRGEVDDYLQARYAWDDAWETEGVVGVVNLLTVRTDLPAKDAQAPETPEAPPGDAG